MSNHPNRNWRSRWKTYQNTYTHRDGWVFVFSGELDSDGEAVGDCLKTPENLTTSHLKYASRITKEVIILHKEEQNA